MSTEVLGYADDLVVICKNPKELEESIVTLEK